MKILIYVKVKELLKAKKMKKKIKIDSREI